jgi:Tol biopolymer transport system component
MAGLYLLDIVSETTFSARIWSTTTLIQGGILSEPVWTADGEHLAVTLKSPYALDIYLYSRDGSERVNLTDSPTYDMWPSFSPDGRYMAFVSDRATCPSWQANDPDFCDALTTETPIGGTVHLMDLASREVRQVADIYVTEAPRWISNSTLVIAGGDQNDLLNPQRTLWLANVNSNQVNQIQLAGDDDSILYLSDSWSPDGSTVIFQRATINETEIVMMKSNGEIIRRRSEDLTFPRFGLRIDWSSTGERIAFGGIAGRCPYGVRVADAVFDWVASGNSPSMCNPIFSPDGASLVFTGVTSEVDGRLDIYSATANGFGQVNITGDLRGTNTLIGWIWGR